MEKKATPPAEPAPRTTSRVVVLLSGVVLGGLWGTVMWLIFELTGKESGFRGWLYLAFSLAMIGGGVAGFFGTWSAARSGARSTPRAPRSRRGRRG